MINFRVWACTLSPLSSTAKHSQILLVDQFFSRFGRWSLYHSHGLVFLAVQAEAENSSIGDCVTHSLTHWWKIWVGICWWKIWEEVPYLIYMVCVSLYLYLPLSWSLISFVFVCVCVFVLAFLYVFVLVQGWAGKAFWLPGTGREIENHIPVLREGNGN